MFNTWLFSFSYDKNNVLNSEIAPQWQPQFTTTTKSVTTNQKADNIRNKSTVSVKINTYNLKHLK
jgi:hypothetical protein